MSQVSTLQSWIGGRWIGNEASTPLHSALTNSLIYHTHAEKIDFDEAVSYARKTGVPALMAMDFQQRAARLKALALYLVSRKEELYKISHLTGATRADSWVDIEGGTGTLFAYASMGSRELPSSNVLHEGPAIQLGKKPTEAKVLWQDRRLRALMAQPLYRKGHVYLLDKRQGLICFALRTGKKRWDDSNRMTPKGRNPQASLVWLGDSDRVIVLNSDGELILARLSPRGYQEQSRTRIIGPTWAHPAYAGACVYARNDRELVCVVLMEGKGTSRN